MKSVSFAELQSEFEARINKMVWCNVATVNKHGRPRSRILHPIWDGPVGWITTRPTSYKAADLAHNPYVSLAYVSDIAKPVYVDCRAKWIDDLVVKQHVWDLVKNAPAPMGFDPEPIYKSVGDPIFGVLKLTPWRLEVYCFPADNLVWHAEKEVNPNAAT